MTDRTLECIEADPSAREAAALIESLDEELRQIYPGEPVHGIDPDEFRRSGGVFLIGRLDGRAVACGALRPAGPGTGEVKRMFVRPEHRRQGFSRAILGAIEERARDRGYGTIRLETGVDQPAAIALYQSAGYYPIPAYGEFADDPRSLCFEKRL